MNENYLSIQNLVVEYSSGGEIVQAVNGVDIELKKGETIGLVGETGAGKTTIAKAILRILQTPPAKIKAGSIKLDQQELLELPEKEMQKVRGNKIAMIFQDPMTALNPTMTVGEQISEVVLQHNHISREDAKKKTIEMLEMVGITALRFYDYPHQFSGGMKQRVVIAMALACNPELLLADEPTTALDVTIQAQVLEMIKALKDKFNTSMILITHDLGVVAETCDQVAVIYAGEIVESGTKEHIFRNPMHPYTLGLFGSLPKLDDDSKRLSPIKGLPPDPTNLPKGCKFCPRCPKAENCSKSQTDVPMIEVEKGHYVRCYQISKGEA
ncbi:MAG: ABC transporter ATP-binding protein [Lachnospiraceae bacterium]|nr:ABC transporter ATP-binding protein [Lachnospiraceae bacterium]